MKNYLGIALVLDVAGLIVAIVLGADVGPLDEIAFALAGGIAGAALPRTAV